MNGKCPPCSPLVILTDDEGETACPPVLATKENCLLKHSPTLRMLRLETLITSSSSVSVAGLHLCQEINAQKIRINRNITAGPRNQHSGLLYPCSSAPIDGIGPHQATGQPLRWKESVLLRVHTLGVARVLFEDRPTGAGDDAAAQSAAKKWTRDDAVCGGHILATLSDRLLPDYQRFATAADLWRGLARTYHVDTPRVWRDKFDAFKFEEGAGGVLLDQITHAEALGVAARLKEGFVAYELCGRLPEVVSDAVVMRSGPDNEMTMSMVWDVARRVVASSAGPERLWRTTTAMADEAEGCCSDGPKPEQSTGRRNRGEPEHVAKNSRRRV